MLKAYDYIKSQPGIVSNDLKGIGLLDSINLQQNNNVLFQ